MLITITVKYGSIVENKVLLSVRKNQSWPNSMQKYRNYMAKKLIFENYILLNTLIKIFLMDTSCSALNSETFFLIIFGALFMV